MRQASLHTPVGEITIFAEADALVALEWGRGSGAYFEASADPLLRDALRQLNAYFDGDLAAFDLPLKPAGTAFQTRVWEELGRIRIGMTKTYGDVAKAVGSAARAIGQANARNPLPILIPCHRVVAAAGQLGGYSGGNGHDTKLWLLSHETRMCRGLVCPADQESEA
jgi:methylated-DNA-[protein]-cysteine S-methyltransferase